jgi:nucleoside-diphosphate-sugar epimerase
MKTVQELEAVLAKPSPELIQDIADIKGDIMLLGVGGKMGPSLARLAINAIKEAGISKKVIGASRFSSSGLKEELEADGLETIQVDLLNDEQLQQLPKVENVIYMAGNKFGTMGNEHFTWAMNAYLPGRVCERYRDSQIVVFSSGNVYPLTAVKNAGASEEISPGPIGEYGQSCLGRERIFEHYSHQYRIPMFIYRLNYAIDLRYGVLLELATQIKQGRTINITMGHANVIWQGDANEMAIRALKKCTAPASFYNVTGPETLSLRWVAERLGEQLGVEPKFTGEEADTALLSNASKSHQAFGYPKVSIRQMIEWTSEWVKNDGVTWNKPTHFQEREGKF